MAVVVAASLTLHLVPIVLLLLVATDDAAMCSITNNCSFTVWPAAVPVGGGVQLNPGQTWTLDVPAGTTSGGLWERTGCSFNRSGHGTCQTGDCGGVLSCCTTGQPPITLAKFTLGGSSATDFSSTTDFFDISITNGFNLPMDFLPAKGGSGCSKGPRCLGNTTSQCPDAYTDPSDGKTFSCPGGTNYQLVFCSPVDLTPMPVTVSPQPAPATVIQITPPSPAVMPLPPGAARTGSSSVSRIVVIIATIGGLIFLIMLFIALFFICKRRTQHQEMEEAEEFGEL